MRRGKNRGAFLHFRTRVLERIGPDVDAHRLWQRLRAYVEAESDKVQFVARVNKSGRRIWRFTVDGRVFFMVYDHEAKCPVTVLPPEGHANCHHDIGRKKINLERHV